MTGPGGLRPAKPVRSSYNVNAIVLAENHVICDTGCAKVTTIAYLSPLSGDRATDTALTYAEPLHFRER